MSVVVIGDANVDLEVTIPSPQGHDLQDNPEPRLFGGGSAANTAAALARLGVPCRFAGTVGDDLYGRFAVADLAAAGVDTQAVTMTASDPTVMVIAVIQPDGERLIYVWPPTGGAHGAVSPDAAVAAVERGDLAPRLRHLPAGIFQRPKALLAAMERARASRGAGVLRPESSVGELGLGRWLSETRSWPRSSTLMWWSAGEPTRSGCSPVSVTRSRPPGR